MSTTAPSPYLNGSRVPPREALREADFLQQALRIRDEVFANKHPRIHLPSKVLEQVASRPTHPSLPSKPPTNGTSNGLPPRPEHSIQQLAPPQELISPIPPQRPFSTKSTSSGIDPVLLTKSDQLIKAELNLKRLQIERALKDQYDKRGRANESLAGEREADVNVEECLIQAQLLVKPVSGLQTPTTHSDGAESFDENSYYSSKADSWSSEDFDPSGNPGTDATETLTSLASQAGAQLNSQARHLDRTVIDLDEEPYEPADDIEIYEPPAVEPNVEGDESDYSPPPADVGSGESNRNWGRGRGTNANGSRRQQSPTGAVPPIQNKRKRKREQRHQASKRVVRSPEPFIKEEPQSPPPFASLSESQSSKSRALQPLSSDVELVTVPRETVRPQPVYYREQEPLIRPQRQYEEPLSPSIVQVPHRRLERDDQDLRRVASLQFARRPYSPSQELYAPGEPRQIRAASHAYADRPEPVYREASARPSAAPRYIQERSRSPVHEYHSRLQSPMVMAPPPRRIIVDQHGNKYFATPAETRESVAPSNRRIVVDPYYERAVTREPTVRAPIRPELYEEEGMQRMPPPPPRRYMEASEAEIVQARSLRQREASHRPVDIEYRPQEVIERRPIVQYEEMGPPREYIPSRAFSVRPEVIRRDAPEGYVRHESVQPSHLRPTMRYREVSVAHQDPYDDPRFAFAAPVPARRYVEEGSTLERPIEVAQDVYSAEPRRVSYRY